MQIFICGWWMCPELYLKRPFHSHTSSRLDSLLEAKAKQGIQVLPFAHFIREGYFVNSLLITISSQDYFLCIWDLFTYKGHLLNRESTRV